MSSSFTCTARTCSQPAQIGRSHALHSHHHVQVLADHGDKNHPFARGRAESVAESIVEPLVRNVKPLAETPVESRTGDGIGKSTVPQLPPKSRLRPRIPLAPAHSVPSALPVRSDSLRRNDERADKSRPRQIQADVFHPVLKSLESTATKPASPAGVADDVQASMAGDSLALRARRQVPASVQMTITPITRFGLFQRQNSNAQLNALSLKVSEPPSRAPAQALRTQARAHGHTHGAASKNAQAGSVLKAQLLGNPARRTEMDLTPGMESGERPPKTGLPMAVSSSRGGGRR